jgi:hypothetical protein
MEIITNTSIYKMHTRPKKKEERRREGRQTETGIERERTHLGC